MAWTENKISDQSYQFQTKSNGQYANARSVMNSGLVAYLSVSVMPLSDHGLRRPAWTRLMLKTTDQSQT